ncbi:AlwI family type II restriction endonuclease [Enterococcus faecalis]|nr:AlwI family type II restriction endonuclease [Enterococcus faecalis]
MKYRTTWFVTRPQRDPNYFPNALETLKIATNNFKEKWNSNRSIQKEYEVVLADKKLKRANISNDGSGGRTWVAMLRTYSLVYLADDGRLVPTKVGLALLEGRKKFDNLCKQLLTLQIPNSYFESTGFRPKFAPDFKIRPIRFLIKIVCQEPLDYYVTREEITFFVMTARTDKQINETVAKIVQFRNASEEEKAEMKREIAELDYRKRSDSGARDFETANGDVAHTFMLQAGYTELVEYSDGRLFINKATDQLSSTLEELDKYDQRYPFDDRYKISESRFGERAGLDVDSYKSRALTDEKVASNQSKEEKLIQEILMQYPNLPGKSLNEVIDIISKDFPPKKAQKIAIKIVEQKSEMPNIDGGFITSYLNQQNDLEFEVQSAEILKSIGFKTVLHPKPVIQGERTNIDILIHIDESTVAIIDAKNYEQKFLLSANLANHMAAEYIPEYQSYEDKEVKYFGYITASKIGGVSNMKKIVNKVKDLYGLEVSGLMISASALLGFLDYCLENDIEAAERKKMFLELLNDNQAYEYYGEVAQRLNID